MKIHLITYGDKRYADQRENFRQSALASGFFDSISIFTPLDIEESFRSQFHEIFKYRRGGGYWIWKPYFIKKALDQIQNDEVLIYCDAGCTINANGKPRFEEYISKLFTHPSGVIAFQLRFFEYQYTKQEIFNYFHAGQELVNSQHYLSGIILLRKSAQSIIMINSWLQAVYDDPWLFTDVLKLSQHKDFVENRHDQSIWSMLVKIYGAVSIPDETYFLDFEEEGQSFPFWATRLK